MDTKKEYDGSMPLKNKKHEQVALLYMQPGHKDYECYMEIYKCKKRTAESNMNRLLNNAVFNKRIEYLKGTIVERGLWTRDIAVLELLEMLSDSKEDRHYTGRYNAIKELTLLCGLYPKEENAELTIKDLIQLIRTLKDEDLKELLNGLS